MAVPIVENGLKFVTEGIKYLNLLLKTSPIRKMKKAIEYAEKYIQVNEKSGEFKEVSSKKQLELLRYYSKKFFKNN